MCLQPSNELKLTNPTRYTLKFIIRSYFMELVFSGFASGILRLLCLEQGAKFGNKTLVVLFSQSSNCPQLVSGAVLGLAQAVFGEPGHHSIDCVHWELLVTWSAVLTCSCIVG